MKGGGFVKSLQLRPLASAPLNPAVGKIVMADGVNWDPLGLGAEGAYLVVYLGLAAGWSAVTAISTN